MDTNPFIEETGLQDEEGQTWVARQTVGIGTAGMGQGIGTRVNFTNETTGLVLRGRAPGLGPHGIEQLRRTLSEAKRRHEAGLPPP